jgi:hypothetical protein
MDESHVDYREPVKNLHGCTALGRLPGGGTAKT